MGGSKMISKQMLDSMPPAEAEAAEADPDPPPEEEIQEEENQLKEELNGAASDGSSNPDGSSSAQPNFAVGQRVQRRDEGWDWGFGYVTNIDKYEETKKVSDLEVTFEDNPNDDRGYHWAEVRLDPTEAEQSDELLGATAGN